MSGNCGFGLRKYSIEFNCHPKFKNSVDKLIVETIMNFDKDNNYIFTWVTHKNQRDVYVDFTNVSE